MNVQNRRDGFSLVEVVVALVVLTVGIFAMAASTGYVTTQIKIAELRTERMAAVHQAAETLRSVDWNQLSATCDTASYAAGSFAVTCDASTSGDLATVMLVSTGPGWNAGAWDTALPDTFQITIAEP
jgi:Tfp pilus assembly protein PilV